MSCSEDFHAQVFVKKIVDVYSDFDLACAICPNPGLQPFLVAGPLPSQRFAGLVSITITPLKCTCQHIFGKIQTKTFGGASTCRWQGQESIA